MINKFKILAQLIFHSFTSSFHPTPNSRVCARHFRRRDFKRTDNLPILKARSTPQKWILPSKVQFKVEAVTMVPDRAGRTLFVRRKIPVVTEIENIQNFSDFVKDLKNHKDSLTAWNIFNQPDGICFYRMKADEHFNDVSISFKILINKELRVKVFSSDDEADDQELDWVLKNCRLESWSQFERMMIQYQKEPVIIEKAKDEFHIQQALEHLRKLRDSRSASVLENELRRMSEEAKGIESWDSKFSEAFNDEIVIESHIEDDELERIVDGIEEKTKTIQNEVGEEIIFEVEDEALHSRLTPESITHPEHSYSMENETSQDLRFAKRPKMSGTFQPDLFKCDFCSRLFLSSESWLSHMDKEHELETPKKCQTCGEIFEKRLSLKKHLEVHHQEPLVCEVCGKQFTSRRRYAAHKTVHENSTKRQCPHCDMIISSSSMTRHINGVHKKLKPHKCSICGRGFAQSGLKKVHEKTHARTFDSLELKDLNATGLKCSKCGRDFKTLSSLKMHLKFNCNGVLRTERKKYVYNCPAMTCEKKYPTRKAAAKHLSQVHKIHIENLENFCFECNAEFDDYMSHVKQHSCNFGCALCSKRFLTEDKLVKHMQKLHSDATEKRPHKCSDCGATFKTENHLRQHKGMRHSTSDELKFACDFCNRKYAFKYILNQHMKTHLGQSFDCDLCDSVTYRKLDTLKQHFLNVHQTNFVHKCSECDERFRLHNDLKNHRQQQHGSSGQKYFEDK